MSTKYGNRVLILAGLTDTSHWLANRLKQYDDVESMTSQIPKVYVTISMDNEPTKDDADKVLRAAKKFNKNFASYTQSIGQTIRITLYDKLKSVKQFQIKFEKVITKALGKRVTISLMEKY